MLIEEVDMLMLTRADATDRKKLLSQNIKLITIGEGSGRRQIAANKAEKVTTHSRRPYREKYQFAYSYYFAGGAIAYRACK
jgi:hypothetical protein